MKTLIILITCVIGSVYLSSCTSSGDLQQIYFDKGVYSFTIYDRGGDSMATGSFEIKNIDGKDISGTYIFDKVYKQSQIIKAGETKEMTGSLTDDRKQIFINANPKLSDSNIFLRITAGLLSYSGEWSYSTMMGILDNGVIKAYKIQ
jgi:hypothetical protein